ncbi:GNAT family N-acetyltransferase [Micromonospora sp. BL4]|uniref:GNAT family N-acetyltransferase n=1 Tax=Micromonospora sp. BL4 TaxID=2478710 RepID=UPI000EF5EE7A|nr:GNAT family N-acetyltransferase [Micromonospora sp. BL4]RLP81287.1 GNAT family N-acetyltransferase [Micromonospora sp. BL4]
MRIRFGDQQDVVGIARVHLATRQATYRGLLPDEVLDAMTPESLTAWWHEYLPQAPEPNKLLVADVDGTPQGFAFLQKAGQRGEVFAIHVHPQAQGQGVGRRLMEQGLAVLRSWGCDRALLWVLADNHGAQGFYRKLGWTPIPEGSRVEDIDGALVAEVSYELPLTQAMPDGRSASLPQSPS